MTDKLRKALISNVQYAFIGLFASKLGQTWRLTEGADIGTKILNIGDGFLRAMQNPLPSFELFDLAIGVGVAVVLRLVMYSKAKNAKKYRHNTEYGSARWGTREDIAPFMDPVFENNVILTQTESLMMSNRPKEAKNARNKNVLVIGGSGSGKTRYFIKPSAP